MPADFADEAQEINEAFLEASLKKVRKTAPPFSGFCLYCEEPVVQRRYCDATCRQAHEALQRRGVVPVALNI